MENDLSKPKIFIDLEINKIIASHSIVEKTPTSQNHKHVKFKSDAQHKS